MNQNNLKLLPQSIETEQVVLGTMLLFPDCIPTVLNKIKPDMFALQLHRGAYEAVLWLYDNNYKVDMITVVNRLNGGLKTNDINFAYEVSKLTSSVVSSSSIEDHCLALVEFWMKREYLLLAKDMEASGYDPNEDVFRLYDLATDKLSKLQEIAIGGKISDMQSYAMKVYESYERVKSTGVLGISTGFNSLDRMICGLVEPDLIILAARPGAGKTSLALSITHNTSVLKDIPCSWFSLEMDGEQLTRKLASIESQIPHEYIRKGIIPSDYENNFYDALQRVGKSKIYIEDKPDMNVRQLRTRLNVLKKKHDIKYAVVDYLQLMSGIDIRNKNRENIISEISRGLKATAKELNIPILALSQLSREVEKRADKMPQLSDLRESGAIEQDADEVIFLMRPEYYGFTDVVQIGGVDYAPRGLCVGKVAKNRHGSTGAFALRFIGETMKFSDHPDTEGGGNYQKMPDGYSPIKKPTIIDDSPF